MEEALRALILGPIHQPFLRLITENMDHNAFLKEADLMLAEICRYTGMNLPEDNWQMQISERLVTLVNIKDLLESPQRRKSKARKYLETQLPAEPVLKGVIVLHILGLLYAEKTELHILALMDELYLNKLIRDLVDGEEMLLLLKTSILSDRWLEKSVINSHTAFESLLQLQEARDYLQVNRYQEVLYCNKERLHLLLGALLTVYLMQLEPSKTKRIADYLNKGYHVVFKILKAAEASGYRIEIIQQMLSRT